jgi:hypothetical protein
VLLAEDSDSDSLGSGDSRSLVDSVRDADGLGLRTSDSDSDFLGLASDSPGSAAPVVTLPGPPAPPLEPGPAGGMLGVGCGLACSDDSRWSGGWVLAAGDEGWWCGAGDAGLAARVGTWNGV